MQRALTAREESPPECHAHDEVQSSYTDDEKAGRDVGGVANHGVKVAGEEEEREAGRGEGKEEAEGGEGEEGEPL